MSIDHFENERVELMYRINEVATRHALTLLSCLTCLFMTSSTAFAAVIVDDGDSGYSTTGTWPESTQPPANEHLGDSKFNNTNAANQTATYAATIPTSGIWSVEVKIPSTGYSDTPYTITHVGGSQAILFDQSRPEYATQGDAEFVSLGYYDFSGGGSYSVEIDASNNPDVIRTDVVRWSQAGVDTPVDFIVDSGGAWGRDRWGLYRDRHVVQQRRPIGVV